MKKKLLSLTLSLTLALGLCAPALAAEPLPTVSAGYSIAKVDANIIVYGEHHFHDGLMPVFEITGMDEDGHIETKWTYLSTAGKLVDLGEKMYGFDFSDGLAPFLENGLGYMDTTGKVIIPAQFEPMDQMGAVAAGRFINGNALVFHSEEQGMDSVMAQGTWTQIDKTGKEVPKTLDEDAPGVIYSDTSGGAAGVTYSVVDIDGVPTVLEFSEGYALVNLAEERTDTMADYQQFYIVKQDAATAANTPVTAAAAASKVIVNGKTVAFDAYVIGGNNYFKLRDFASAVSGTEKQFKVSWNSAMGAIELASGVPYTAVGGELTPGDGTAKSATLNGSPIYMDFDLAPLRAYTIGGNNYFKLRDLCAAFDIFVGWDGATGTVSIDTTKGYVAE